MPSFAFTAVDLSGSRHKGVRVAASDDAATATLRAEGLFVLQVSEAVAPTAARYTSLAARRDLLDVTRTIATLLPAGLPLPRALDAAGTMGSGALSSILADICARVERGERLAAALGIYPTVFKPHYVGLVRAGERTGDLPAAFIRLSDLLEREAQLRSRLVSALLYPLILAVAGGAAMLVLLLVVLPNFAELLTDSGARLPATTEFVLAASALFRRYWFLLPAAVVSVTTLLAALRRRPSGRLALARFVDRMPLAGALVRDTAAARFARTTGTLLAGGAPLLNALEDATIAAGSALAHAAGARAQVAVREGMSLHRALEREDSFPPLLAQLTALGEESARLGEFLLKAAHLFEERSERTIQRLVTLTEPALIVVFGGAVGLVALSLLQAIYSVNAGSFN